MNVTVRQFTVSHKLLNHRTDWPPSHWVPAEPLGIYLATPSFSSQYALQPVINAAGMHAVGAVEQMCVRANRWPAERDLARNRQATAASGTRRFLTPGPESSPRPIKQFTRPARMTHWTFGQYTAQIASSLYAAQSNTRESNKQYVNNTT